jgi:hypothetical protein
MSLARISLLILMVLVIPLLITSSAPPGRIDTAMYFRSSATHPSRAAPVVLSLPEAAIDPGETIDVNLVISTTEATRAIQFVIEFDPSVLRCESISEGSFYRDWAAAHSASTLVLPNPTCDNSSGKVTIMGITILGGEGGPSGEGIVTAIQFTTLAEGISPLTLSQVLVADDSAVSKALETTLINGRVTVGHPIPLEDTVLRAALPSNSVAPGGTFDVIINISTLPPTRGAQFGLEFDPAILRCESVSTGPFYNDWAVNHGGIVFMIPAPLCDNVQGEVSVMGITILTLSTTESGGPVGQGMVAAVRFTALAEGNSPLNLNDVIVADTSPASQALPTSVINGEVAIKHGAIYLPIIVNRPGL